MKHNQKERGGQGAGDEHLPGRFLKEITLQRSPIAPWNRSCHSGLGDMQAEKGKIALGSCQGCLGGREKEFGFHPPIQSFPVHTNMDLIYILPNSEIEFFYFLFFFSPREGKN